VHPASLRDLALVLVAEGINDCEIARRLGVPRTTVRDWRRPRYLPRGGRERGICARCWRPTPRIVFSDADYAELLGLYLGDGHIAAMARTEMLRISLDAKYPRINDEIAALLGRCFPDNRVGRVLFDGGSTVVLHVYSRHLSCLFPQAGPGKKHERPIVLEAWQRERVAAAPWSFLRGCIRSDGCAFVNRTGRYEYLSYAFANLSDDIRGLFVDTCRLVGVDCRPGNPTVRVNRRASVALLEQHVGLKS
jgi:Homeodomain-like domain-containing protein